MSSETNDLKAKGYFVATLDGKNNTTKAAFLENIGKAFNFPDYYGKNLDALEECINDLSWLEEENFALVIDNSADLLSKESKDVKASALETLSDASKSWAGGDNGEKADFKVILK